MQVVLVYLQPFWLNSLLKCMSQLKIATNLLKPLILGIQNHSRSSTLTFLRSSSPVLVMISSTSVPICNHFHARRAYSRKNNAFLKGCPSFAPSFEGIPFTQRDEILSQNTKDTKLSYGENPKS